VEDTDRVTFESIEAEFGTAVRRIVEGETKVSKVRFSLSQLSPFGAEGLWSTNKAENRDCPLCDAVSLHFASTPTVAFLRESSPVRARNDRAPPTDRSHQTIRARVGWWGFAAGDGKAT
jgi:hypothetical protein